MDEYPFKQIIYKAGGRIGAILNIIFFLFNNYLPKKLTSYLDF